MTEWRDIPGWEGFYQVSDDGQVRSLDREQVDASGRLYRYKGRLLRSRLNSSGYPRLTLTSNRGGLYTSVHALVLLAFAGPRPDGMQCRHLNGIPTDNRIENLCYGTISENIRDQVRHGTHYAAGKTHCPRNHPFDELNTRINGNGARICRACARIHHRAYLSRKAAAA